MDMARQVGKVMREVREFWALAGDKGSIGRGSLTCHDGKQVGQAMRG